MFVQIEPEELQVQFEKEKTIRAPLTFLLVKSA